MNKLCARLFIIISRKSEYIPTVTNFASILVNGFYFLRKITALRPSILNLNRHLKCLKGAQAWVWCKVSQTAQEYTVTWKKKAWVKDRCTVTGDRYGFTTWTVNRSLEYTEQFPFFPIACGRGCDLVTTPGAGFSNNVPSYLKSMKKKAWIKDKMLFVH